MTLLCPCMPLAKGIVAEIDASLQEGTFAHPPFILFSLAFFICCSMALKQQSGTVTQQALRSLTQLKDDVSGGLLLSYQAHRFACIDIGEIVVLAGDRLCKLLTRFVGLRECIDVGVPAIGKVVAQGSAGILWRPGKSLRDAG
jgi:hypothetical protein